MSHHWNGTTRARLAIPTVLMATALLLAGCATSGGQQAGVGGTAATGAPTVTDEVKSFSGDYGQDSLASPEAAREGAATAPSIVATGKLVVVNKTMRIETADVDEAIAKIRTLVKRDGADISSMQVASDVDEPIYREPAPLADGSVVQSSRPLRAYITVRVPSDKYAAFIADAARLGRILTEYESSDDVTQQHVDMQARLDNLKAEQVRLRQLFARATNVKDMLAVEQELSRVQGEIESMKAQIDYLERQAARATVTLELTEPEALVAPSGIDWGVRTAFTDGVRAFVSTMNGLIFLLGPVLAVLLFVGLPVALIARLLVRGFRRRRSRLQAASTAVPESADATPGPGELDS